MVLGGNDDALYVGDFDAIFAGSILVSCDGDCDGICARSACSDECTLV